MRKKTFGVTFVLLLALTACSGGGAPELFETAKFEELQNNRDHAIQLYEQIVQKFPQSKYAREAEERLKELKAAR